MAMPTFQDFLLLLAMKVMLPTGIFALTLLAGALAKRQLFKILRRWADKTQTRADDVLLEALKRPLSFWIVILALHLAMQASELPASATALIGKGLLILWVISLTLFASRLVGQVIKNYGTTMDSALPVNSLTENLARASVFTVGGLVLLNLFGVSITPILTALGVGGLAVALALQDTLSNLFAGFYVSVSGKIKAGHYIKLDSGEEGYVTDITWRSTTIRALPNNLIIVPNAKLAQAIVTNYHLPEKRMSLLIPISVSYDSDPAEVERLLIEEAKKGASDIPGLLAEPAPFVRFIPGFGESSLNFTLICQVAEFVDQYLAQHELRKRIFKRFHAAGIEIPFPIRTVHLRTYDHNAAAKERRPHDALIVGASP